MRQHDLSNLEERLKRASDLGDPLEVMNDIIDFEVFRPVPDRALRRSDRRKSGRPPLDPVMMFKILILQALNDLCR
ncbi:MAG: transposase [Hyphomonadaceae bacterium]|nr:transposase [Hyphomonadaceae bacterium]